LFIGFCMWCRIISRSVGLVVSNVTSYVVIDCWPQSEVVNDRHAHLS